MAEARVFFTSAPGPIPDIAMLTNEEGQFSLQAPTPGRYEITCMADGFAPAKASVEILPNLGKVEINFEMRPLG